MNNVILNVVILTWALHNEDPWYKKVCTQVLHDLSCAGLDPFSAGVNIKFIYAMQKPGSLAYNPELVGLGHDEIELKEHWSFIKVIKKSLTSQELGRTIVPLKI